MEQRKQLSNNSTSRRSFLRKGLVVGSGIVGAGLLTNGVPDLAFAEKASGSPTKGDVAILRFLAAAEILESDLWQQYNELAGIQDGEVPGGSGSPIYREAIRKLDLDMPQYIPRDAQRDWFLIDFVS